MNALPLKRFKTTLSVESKNKHPLTYCSWHPGFISYLPVPPSPQKKPPTACVYPLRPFLCTNSSIIICNVLKTSTRTILCMFFFTFFDTEEYGMSWGPLREALRLSCSQNALPEPRSQCCRKPSTHHLKVSAHEAAEILLVPAIELQKETKPKPKM